ncbi:MAG: hypothetical protein VKJ04_04455 [Vampirovibrionales bacterium]|nr:hypothetical protein [Vampirovibrionales bacterium]
MNIPFDKEALLKNLKETDWKLLMSTAVQVLMDPKVAGTLIFMIFVIYGIGYDTVFKPALQQLSDLDKSLKSQQEGLKAQQAEKEKYANWAKSLEGLQTKIIKVEKGEVPTVVAAGQLGKIEELLSGKKRNESSLEPLPAPHDKLTQGTVNQVGSTEVTIATPPQAEAAPSEESLKGRKEIPNTGQPVESGVKLIRFDYEGKVQGTFIALTDLINQLAVRSNLIVIRDITLTPVPPPNDYLRPDPKTQEEATVPLEMTLKLSVYIAPEDTSAANASPARARQASSATP